MAKTKVQIIEETVNYYSSDPGLRAVKYELKGDHRVQQGCLYLDHKGHKCSVGRCMIPTILENRRDEINRSGSVNDLIRTEAAILGLTFEDLLLPAYKGHEPEFWTDVQTLHDNASFWNEKGLTDLGKRFTEELNLKWTKR